ncbi:MAG: 8-oxo-dGTP pyrophosphatase MutT (NUDIX family) [Candidatus Paceibacteria bacterium]|jgi:8-oxo-dGTP pyrophosphatase MutT (NUDIX family)
MRQKALLIPFNSEGKMFIQDRTDYKPPPWGFFGGSIEEGETHLQAILRETKEELDLDLTENDLIYMGELHTEYDGELTERYFYLYKTDQVEFTVLEGAGGKWVTFTEAELVFKRDNKLPEIIQLINAHTERK